jgi:periplasmic protein TonB
VNLLMFESPRPPLLGVVLAVGLHLAFLVSLQITATKSSIADVAFTRAAVMVVRSIEAATASASATPQATKLSNLPPVAVPSGLGATPTVMFGGVVSRSAGEMKPTPAHEYASPSPSPVLPAPLVTASAASASPASELPAAPQYRAAGSLDPGPKPLSDINPDYPTRAGQQQGIVVLRLLINEQGVVDNVAVVRASPAGYFEESALEAFGKALFSPGKLLGLAVKSQITIEVEFMPINRGATVSGRTY